MIEKERFVEIARQLVRGMLREAIGYRVEEEIKYFQGIVGYMVEAPLLWIRHSRFPILFIAYDCRRPDVLTAIVRQLEIAKVSEHFAILIVVPTDDSGTGNEAQELRHVVANSGYRYDFVVLDHHYLASIIGRGTAERLIEVILEQGIELSSLSPYVVRGPVSGNMFFGRELEIKTIAQAIQDGDYAVLGGRRIGKSSTLLKLNRFLNNDPRYHAIYMNCEDKFTHCDLVDALAHELGEGIDGQERLTFRELVSRLKAVAPGKQLVFLFDEVDELLAADEARSRLFKSFRALSHQHVCRFVFSGSRTLHKHLRDPRSPFFNFCQDLRLRPLEEKSVTEIITRPMRQLGIEIDDQERFIDNAIRITSSHPNIVQWLCDRLIKTTTVRRLTVSNLHSVSEETEFRREYEATAWGDANALEKLISVVMEGPSFTLDDVSKALASFGLTDKQRIVGSLDILQLYSLLESDGQTYRFRLAQFPAVLRKLEDIPSLTQSLLNQMET